jgi:hypothetical protein
VREDLPASVASDVMMIVSRKDAAPEEIALGIDDSGESWVAAGKPVASDADLHLIERRRRSLLAAGMEIDAAALCDYRVAAVRDEYEARLRTARELQESDGATLDMTGAAPQTLLL